MKTGADRLAIEKSMLANDFFILSTQFAGEALQKLINYRFKIAIFGDYSHYTSKPLKDFMYELIAGAMYFCRDARGSDRRLEGAE